MNLAKTFAELVDYHWKRNLLKLQQASQTQSRREDGYERRQRAVSALESVVATQQHQMRSERRVCVV